jgi:hypothetical protein
MNGNTIRVTLLAFLIVSGTLTSGCALFLVGAGVAIGAGTVAYTEGELRAADEVGYEKAWAAANSAMHELQFQVTGVKRDALMGRIDAKRPDDTKISIKVKSQTEKVTEYRIRVGTFGDEHLSRVILDKIRSLY